MGFEPEIGVSTFAAGMPSKVPYPLEEYAYRGVSDNNEYLPTSSSLPFGVRVEGTLVPIPGAVWLLGSGLIGLIGIRRKLKNK